MFYKMTFIETFPILSNEKMENFIFIVSSLYLLSFIPFVLSKTLNLNNSFVSDFSLYINNLFIENSLNTNVRKIRSNSDQNSRRKDFDTKHSFVEIPVLEVESQNKTPLWSEMSETSKQTVTGDHQFTPDASIDRLKSIAENLFATTRSSATNNSHKVYVQQKIFNEFQRNNLIVLNQMFITSARESNVSSMFSFCH